MGLKMALTVRYFYSPHSILLQSQMLLVLNAVIISSQLESPVRDHSVVVKYAVCFQYKAK